MTMMVFTTVSAHDERRGMQTWFRYAQKAAARGFTLIELIDNDSGQITIAYTTRVAPAGSNTLVLVPSAPDNADTPTARIALVRGSVQAGR